MAGRPRTLKLKTEVEVTGADKLNNLGKQLQKVGGILSATVTAPLALLGSKAAGAASDLNESMNAVETVFGSAADKVNEFGEAAAQSAGLAQSEFNALVVPIGSMLQNVGFAADEAAEASINLAQRAADMASVFNTDVSEALGAIQAGLRGEADPLERFGVRLSAAAVDAKALSLGLADTTAALTDTDRAHARLALVMEQTDRIAGDFAATSDEVANKQRIAAAEAENAAAALGQKFLPIQEKLIDVASGLVDAFNSLPPPMQDIVVVLAGLAAAAGPVLLAFGSLLRVGTSLARQLPKLNRELLATRAGLLGIAVAAGEALFELSGFINDATSRLNDELSALVDGQNIPILEKAVQHLADTLGVSFEEIERRILAFVESGLTLEEALRRVAGGFKPLTDALKDETGNVALGVGDAVARGLTAGAGAVDGAAGDMADGIPGAMADAEAEAMEIARRTPGSLANELRAGIDDYDKALEELADTAANSVSDLAERQKIEGILASQELTDALNSDSTRTRLLALDLVNDLVSDYELLGPGALEAGALVNPALREAIFANLGLATEAGEAVVDAAGNPLLELPEDARTYGYNTAVEFAAGMTVGKGVVVDAARQLASSARSQIAIESEPPDPNSPLHGITKWGGNIVQTLADGITANLNAGRSAAAALAGTLSPSLALSGEAPMAASGGGDVHIHLTVQGDLRADEQTLPETIRRAVLVGGIGT